MNAEHRLNHAPPPKSGVYFFFVRFPEWSLFFPFSLGQNEFKLIELYNYPSHLSLYFSPVHKIIIFIVHNFPLQISSLFINYPRLYLSLSCFSYLPIPFCHRHITSPNDLWSTLPSIIHPFSSTFVFGQYAPVDNLRFHQKTRKFSPRLPHLSFSILPFVYVWVTYVLCYVAFFPI